MKWTIAFALFALAACGTNINPQQPYITCPDEVWADSCEPLPIISGQGSQSEPSKPDEPVSEPDNPRGGGNDFDHPSLPDNWGPSKPRDNRGHGNGNEGNCRGSGCSDSDNPGKGKAKGRNR